MKFIIEGPSCAGKTTLAKRLVKLYKLKYYHEGPPPKNVNKLKYYSNKLEVYKNENFVLDRFAIGERIYGPLLRDDYDFNFKHWVTLQKLLIKYEIRHIILIPSYRICYNRWINENDNLIKTKQLFLRLYDRWLDIIYEFESFSANELIQFTAIYLTPQILLYTPIKTDKDHLEKWKKIICG